MKKILIGMMLFTNVVYGQTKLDSLIFDKINEYRVENSLSILIFDTLLYKVAINQSEFMSIVLESTHDQFKTKQTRKTKFIIEKDFLKRFTNQGLKFYDDFLIGENVMEFLFRPKKDIETKANDIIEGWKNSETHNDLLLNPDMKFASVGSTIIYDAIGLYPVDPTFDEVLNNLYYITFEAVNNHY